MNFKDMANKLVRDLRASDPHGWIAWALHDAYKLGFEAGTNASKDARNLTPPADPKASPEEMARNWWVVAYNEDPKEDDGNWIALTAAFNLACKDAVLRETIVK